MITRLLITLSRTANLLTKHSIQLRKVEVHNLKRIDLDLPHRRLIAICGVSGSGKTSLALDTLYAEGQRRYIESFSAYTRQFLERLEKPAAERIDGLPPAIAVTHRQHSQSSRTTIGTATETIDYLRLLFARIGQVICPTCHGRVQPDSPETACERLMRLPDSVRFMVTFAVQPDAGGTVAEQLDPLVKDGFVRALQGNRVVRLDGEPRDGQSSLEARRYDIIVDRLVAGSTGEQRTRDSLEIAFQRGHGACAVYVNRPYDDSLRKRLSSTFGWGDQPVHPIDGGDWFRVGFSRDMTCDGCGIEFPVPDPRLYSFNSPMGACPQCEGFGNTIEIDMERVVPDPSKSIRDGAIAPWNTPAYSHELDELLELAGDYGIPVDVPFSQLDAAHLRWIHDGVPERNFGGLSGFFAWLEKRKYKMHVRVFLSRWRTYHTCACCHGKRLRPEALATKLAGFSIADLCQLKISRLLAELRALELTDWQQEVSEKILEQVIARLGYLVSVGLGYLTLERTLRTLSNGELQRVALASTLGSSLVNMLYVLDEPSIGLHPHDIVRLLGTIHALRDRGNTVVIVEHDETMITTADQVVEIGPAAGERGGRVVFQGSPEELTGENQSLTGEYLAGRRGISLPEKRRSTKRGWLKLTGASGNNLKRIDVDFPLGVLCLVTGVSGSGKSSLVQDTLYPALRARKRKDGPKPKPFDDVIGAGQIEDVILVDQSPIGRSPRSNPVTYIKAFDAIRAVFAETLHARTHNYSAGHFSFNVDGGRCNACKGDGYSEIDMQFLANVFVKCSQCNGQRYRREILEVTYRGKNIADVLEMTVRQAFSFFRGQMKVQEKLKRLIDVGLDYLRLGQGANTLSAGEAQRLRLASYLNSAKRSRTLFLMDEPTTGLHFSDVVQLLDCFDALLAVGHSLIIVEHNLQLMRAADYIIDLGPGAADQGGRVVAVGTPEQIADSSTSVTGPFLRDALNVGLEPVEDDPKVHEPTTN